MVVGAGGFVTFNLLGIWSGNEKYYENILTPLVLNNLDPELSHRLAVFVAKYHLFKSAPNNSKMSTANSSNSESQVDLVK